MKETQDEAIAKAIAIDEIFSALPAVPALNPTWLEIQEHEVNTHPS